MNGKKRGHNFDDNDDSNNMIDYENRENGSHEEEEEDHDNNNNISSSNKKRKNSKKSRPSKIMSESGQTDADRRLLRARQRELHNDIAVGGGGGGVDAQEDGITTSAADRAGGGGGDADELKRLRTQNNELWRDVRYTREAVLDSENVDLIASKAARQAEKIVQVSKKLGWGRKRLDDDNGYDNNM